MLTDDQIEGIVSALQEDCKDLPPCGHAACTVINVVFGDMPTDNHDFDVTSMHFLGWLDTGMNEVITACSELMPTQEATEALVKSELAVWFIKGVMFGKKLARVDDEA